MHQGYPVGGHIVSGDNRAGGGHRAVQFDLWSREPYLHRGHQFDASIVREPNVVLRHAPHDGSEIDAIGPVVSACAGWGSAVRAVRLSLHAADVTRAETDDANVAYLRVHDDRVRSAL